MAEKREDTRADFEAYLQVLLPKVYNVSEPIPLQEGEIEEDMSDPLLFPSPAASLILNSTNPNFCVLPLPPTVITEDTAILNRRFEAISLGAVRQPATRFVPVVLPPILPPTLSFFNNSPIVVLSEEQWLGVAPLLDPNSQEVVINRGDFKITKKVLARLLPKVWLNDDLMNLYLSLVEKRSLETYGLRVKAMDTLFYTRLETLSSRMDVVSRSLRKVDIFACDMLVIPIHLGQHWCMVVVNFNDMKLRYFDSMALSSKGVWTKNPEVVTRVKAFLESHYRLTKNLRKLDLGISFPTGIPQQENFSDCGVFALKFAEYSSRGAPFTFRQADMPNFRRRMAWELINDTLLYP